MNGLDLAVWEWPGEGPSLVFAHATGFHARLWDPIIRRFPGRHCWAVDMRGHGRSAKPAPPYRWRNFGEDLAGIIRHLGLRDVTAIGHSMGGHAVARAASLMPEAFSALLLVDPTIFPVDRYSQPPLDGSFTLRRKNVWHSTEEMWQRFHLRRPFAAWRPEALRAYCEFGLLPEGDHLVLACPPPVEASIYENSNSPESNIQADLHKILQPVTVLRAETLREPGVFDLSASPAAPELASWLKHGRDVPLAGHSHYIPMESPDAVEEEIRHLILLASPSG